MAFDSIGSSTVQLLAFASMGARVGGGGGVGLGEPGALPCDLSPSGHPGPLSVGSDGDVLPDTGAHADITSRWLKTAAVLAGKGARE